MSSGHRRRQTDQTWPKCVCDIYSDSLRRNSIDYVRTPIVNYTDWIHDAFATRPGTEKQFNNMHMATASYGQESCACRNRTCGHISDVHRGALLTIASRRRRQKCEHVLVGLCRRERFVSLTTRMGRIILTFHTGSSWCGTCTPYIHEACRIRYAPHEEVVKSVCVI